MQTLGRNTSALSNTGPSSRQVETTLRLELRILVQSATALVPICPLLIRLDPRKKWQSNGKDKEFRFLAIPRNLLTISAHPIGFEPITF